MKAAVLLSALLLGAGCDRPRPPLDPPAVEADALSIQVLDAADADSTAPSLLHNPGPSTDRHSALIQDIEAGVLLRARRLTSVYSDEQWAAAAARDSIFEADSAIVDIWGVGFPIRRDTSYLVVRYTEAGGWERAPASVWDAARPTAECDYPDRLPEVGPEPDRDGRARPVPPGVWGRFVLDEAPSPDSSQTAWLSSGDAVGSGFLRSPHHLDPFALTVVGDSARTFHVSPYPLYACWSPAGAFVVVVGEEGGRAWAAAPAR